MFAIPPLVLLLGSVALGLLLGLDYLRRVRSKPALVGFHLLMGAAATELIAMFLRGTPGNSAIPVGPLLQSAAALLGIALLTGLVAPMIGRRSRSTMNIALIVHVSASTAGVVLCLLWFARAAKGLS